MLIISIIFNLHWHLIFIISHNILKTHPQFLHACQNNYWTTTEWITKCKVFILSSLPSDPPKKDSKGYQKIDCLKWTALKSSRSKDRKFQVLPESSMNNTTQQKTGWLTFTPAFTDVINWSHRCSNVLTPLFWDTPQCTFHLLHLILFHLE